MSITTSWQKKSTKSKRNWKRRGAHDSRNSLAWWAMLGLSNLWWLSPTPWAQDRQSDLPVSSQTLNTFGDKMIKGKDDWMLHLMSEQKLSVTDCLLQMTIAMSFFLRWTCVYAQHAKSDNEPHAGVSRYVFVTNLPISLDCYSCIQYFSAPISI